MPRQSTVSLGVTRTKVAKGRKNLVPAENILIGVEMEFTHPDYNIDNPARVRAPLNETMEVIMTDQSKISTIKFNGSGRDGGGVEVKTEPYNFNIWSKHGFSALSEITSAFKAHTYTADNQWAGMHVHIDRHIFTFKQFKAFVLFIAEIKEFMKIFSRRGARTSFINPGTKEGKNGQEFLKTTEKELEEKFKNRTEYYGNNCIVLNTHGSVGTIECRFFNGTLDPKIAMANIEFIRAMCYFIKSKRSKSLTNFIDYVINYVPKYPYLIEYMNQKNLMPSFTNTLSGVV